MSRQIPLTKGLTALVDDDDYARVTARSWHATNAGYAATKIRQRTVFLSRFVMDEPAGLIVDHVNGDRLDNRKANLRICDAAENTRNRKRPANNTSGFKGVSRHWRGGRWNVQIQVDGKFLRIGTYADPVAAAVHYDRAALEHFGSYARLNFDPARDWIFPQLVGAHARADERLEAAADGSVVDLTAPRKRGAR
jgi:hypothetical protein